MGEEETAPGSEQIPKVPRVRVSNKRRIREKLVYRECLASNDLGPRGPAGLPHAVPGEPPRDPRIQPPVGRLCARLALAVTEARAPRARVQLAGCGGAAGRARVRATLAQLTARPRRVALAPRSGPQAAVPAKVGAQSTGPGSVRASHAALAGASRDRCWSKSRPKFGSVRRRGASTNWQRRSHAPRLSRAVSVARCLSPACATSAALAVSAALAALAASAVSAVAAHPRVRVSACPPRHPWQPCRRRQ
jgi:hypothetical protein